MTKQPIVSVVIPCHNDGRYLRQAVDSCLQQTFQSIEIIVVDDGSDDRSTQNVLSELSDVHITLLHADHVGPAGARNMAIDHSHGSYILPLDADDWIEPEYIERAVEVLDARSDVGIVYCHASLFGEKEGVWDLPDYSLKNFLLDNCIFITALFRKEDWVAVGGFSDEFKHGLEDYDFWLSLVEKGRQVHQFKEVWFHYRIKETSRSKKLNASYTYALDTYTLLYMRHRTLYQTNMDTYCLGMRQALIEARMMSGTGGAHVRDPVGEYWNSIRLLKPGCAKRVEAILALKTRLVRLMHRAE